MGTHLRVLSESYPMSTNMTEFRWFLHPCALDESSLSIGRLKQTLLVTDQPLLITDQYWPTNPSSN